MIPTPPPPPPPPKKKKQEKNTLLTYGCTHLRVLRERYLMHTNMTWCSCFSKIFALDESIPSVGRVHACSDQKQPESFSQTLQAKAYLGKYLKENITNNYSSIIL